MVFNISRLISGLTILLICILSFYFNFDFYFISIICLLIAFECYKNNFLKKKNIFYILFVLLLFFIFVFSNVNNIFLFIFLVITLCLSIVYNHNHLFLISLIILFIYSSIVLLMNDRYYFYLLLLISFINDSTAYIFGNLLKGPKIIPRISPNKTWSGTSISFLVSLMMLLFILDLNIIFCIFISALFFLGDIYFSFIKRKNNIKDFSNLIPGHGGILDRVDSFLFPLIIMSLII